ncbi:hypothetical protein Tco_0582359, partial [Tanacetum coccineum]
MADSAWIESMQDVGNKSSQELILP